MVLAYPRFASNARLRNAAENSPWMKYGELGEAVSIVQQSLIDLGYPFVASVRPDGSTDGDFGYETKSMVRAFQRSTPDPIRDDGIVGHDTMYKLDKAILSEKPIKPISQADFDNDLAKGLTLFTLASPSVSQLNFRLGPVSIFGTSCETVKQHILHGRIGVAFDQHLDGWAKYEPTGARKNTMLLSFKEAGLGRRALIVHEALHAYMDIQSMLISTAESEGAAYVGQCMYLYCEGIRRLELDNDDLKMNDIVNAAWKIAEMKIKKEAVPNGLVVDLQTKIQSHWQYGTGTYPGFNGV